MTGVVRLRAVDIEDLRVVSALLQDAIIPIADMAFLPDAQQFVMLASRFQWEGRAPEDGPTPDDGAEAATRINCAVHFSGVTAVRRRGVDLRQRGAFLSLLALEPSEGALLLRLSGGADIRLEGGAIECRLSDRGDPWPVPARPDHGLD
ncbi:hypothetical protein CHU95_14585 [Niveispirillum lacus]|uniref:DUF2948 domain-containing protein n=1 Tax=Niveispirillum lacus TaxID=1981099 RepID=A0A255YWP7_9PROT|nr:DUF2948 family protein [Niveispirillum lacus]OYQ33601.1 hypothetical protein CHU95_14585 [Niveispirillum lacus]